MNTAPKSPGFFSSWMPLPKFADPAKRRIANLQNLILWGMFIATLLYALMSLLGQLWTSALIGLVAGIVIGGTLFLLRRGYTMVVSWIVIFTIYIVDVLGLLEYSLTIINVLGFSVLIILAGLLLPPGGVIFSVSLSLVTLYGFTFIQDGAIDNLLITLLGLAVQGFLLSIASYTFKNSFAEIDASTQNLLQANQHLENLNARVEERAHDLELVADIARTITGNVANLQYMLSQAVELINSRFNLYHTQIYLTNSFRKTLILGASTGETGQRLLAQGFRLLINQDSGAGRAFLEKQPILLEDVTQNSSPNGSLLPDSRAELVIPLISGEEIIGVLDMHACRPNVFNEFNLPTFKTLAGQLAITIQNANLFQETQEARELTEASTRQTVEQGWQAFLDGIHHPGYFGYVYAEEKAVPLAQKPASPVPANTLTVPIVIAGVTVGNIQVPADEAVDEAQIAEVLEMTSAQLGRHLENLRLLEQAEQYRAEAEQAARRLTREGWDTYQKNAENVVEGYIYNNHRVKPLHNQPTEDTPSIQHPLTIRGETIGSLELAFPEETTALDAETTELITSVSNALATHIENLRLAVATQTALAQTENQARRLAQLNEMSTALNQAARIEDLLLITLQMTPKIMKADISGLALLTPDEQHMEAFIEQDGKIIQIVAPEGITIPLTNTSAEYVIQTRRILIIPDTKTSPKLDIQDMARTGMKTVVQAPLVLGTRVLGVLNVMSFSPSRQFTEQDATLLQQVATIVATTLENLRLLQQATQRAEREALINAINQRVQSATTVESALEIATREIGHLLKARRATVELSIDYKGH